MARERGHTPTGRQRRERLADCLALAIRLLGWGAIGCFVLALVIELASGIDPHRSIALLSLIVPLVMICRIVAYTRTRR